MNSNQAPLGDDAAFSPMRSFWMKELDEFSVFRSDLPRSLHIRGRRMRDCSSLQAVRVDLDALPRRSRPLTAREKAQDRLDAFVVAVLAKVCGLSGRVNDFFVGAYVSTAATPKWRQLVARPFGKLRFSSSQLGLKFVLRRLRLCE